MISDEQIKVIIYDLMPHCFGCSGPHESEYGIGLEMCYEAAFEFARRIEQLVIEQATKGDQHG